MKGKKINTRRLVMAALIAAVYTALTVLLTPFSYGVVQCRVAEALTVLAAFTPSAIPGLAVGCALSNLLGVGVSPIGAVDVLVGTLATLAAACLSRRWRNVRWWGMPILSVLPPIVINALVVGVEAAVAANNFAFTFVLLQMATVAIGQTVACGVGGLLLAKGLTVTGADKIISRWDEPG